MSCRLQIQKNCWQQNLGYKLNIFFGNLDSSQFFSVHPIFFFSLNQKLFLTKDVHFDVEVAADETGNYTKVMDAVNVAPKSNMKYMMVLSVICQIQELQSKHASLLYNCLSHQPTITTSKCNISIKRSFWSDGSTHGENQCGEVQKKISMVVTTEVG